jgi:hypothetical protein
MQPAVWARKNIKGGRPMKIWGQLGSATLISLFLMAQALAASRAIRADAPTYPCDLQNWAPTGASSAWSGTAQSPAFVSGMETVTTNTTVTVTPYQGIDPYGQLDGSTASPSTLFQPGTIVTTGNLVYCIPDSSLAFVWNNDPVSGTQPPNPASLGDPTLTATAGVMYEWINATDPNLAPDAEVIVWSVPSNSGSNSSIHWPGGFELEFDNWCGTNDNGQGSPAPANAVASFSWNGNTYTAACTGFNGYDLLLNSSGVVIGYVEFTPSSAATNNKVVLAPASSVPGWTVQLVTTTTISLPPGTVEANSPITFLSAVSALPGGPVPGGSVTFNNGSTALGSATLVGGIATLTLQAGLNAGTYTLTTSYSGDVSHAPSSSASQTLTVPPTPAVAMADSPAGTTVAPGQSATTIVTLTPSNGFNAMMSLSCVNPPSGINCSFSPASVMVNGASSKSTLTITTTAPTASNTHHQGSSPLFPGGVLVAGVAFAIILRRRPQRILKQVGFLASLFVAMFGLSSCSGGGGNSGPTTGSPGTAAGSYTLTIQATTGTTTKTIAYVLTVS